MSYDLTDYQLAEIKALYKAEHSAKEIKSILKLSHGVRQIQRRIKEMGISRTRKTAFNLAVKKGMVGAIKKKSTIKRMKLPAMLRYMIMKRDNFRCILCGATAKDRLLEIDHIDFNPLNNDPKNLQLLCEWCNFGRRKSVDELHPLLLKSEIKKRSK